ncbi:hypothetical protein BU16DRAFT_558505 [Lophium mytilinum]|uniref:Uncharacterized protein n=1 Tax=Lophium mytilinum TaxID=390894 RepID=A0A6A6R160_9PEZI|nr:hypothetical protein BU16DRAFT_558505 [Lophium mytilinum]
MGSGQSTPAMPPPATAANMGADLKTPGTEAAKPKVHISRLITSINRMAPRIVPEANRIYLQPCCVCKEEKNSRDECMLFSKSDNPQGECQDLVSKYRSCMAGYGFQIPA